MNEIIKRLKWNEKQYTIKIQDGETRNRILLSNGQLLECENLFPGGFNPFAVGALSLVMNCKVDDLNANELQDFANDLKAILATEVQEDNI
jgi:hypothetical protein